MKTVVITGASRGIGEATAEKFLSEGFLVIGTSTSGRVSISNENLKAYKLDLSKPESIKEFSEKIKKEHKEIDVLINNAGVLLDFENKEFMEKVRDTLEVNLIGLIDLTEQLIPLINSGGHIINISSIQASLSENTDSYAPSYKISKVGVNMYTKILANTLRGKNITVSSIDPGWVKTDMGGASAPRDPSAPAEEIFEMVTSDLASGYFWHRGQKRSW